MTTISKTASLKGVSNLIVERLAKEPDFRQKFQTHPADALRECGVPEEVIPSPEVLGKVDLIEFGRRLEQVQIRGEAAIAVACVVI